MKKEEIDEKALQQKKDYELQKLADEITTFLELHLGKDVLDWWVNGCNGQDLTKATIRMYNRAKRIKGYENKTNK